MYMPIYIAIVRLSSQLYISTIKNQFYLLPLKNFLHCFSLLHELQIVRKTDEVAQLDTKKKARPLLLVTQY